MFFDRFATCLSTLRFGLQNAQDAIRVTDGRDFWVELKDVDKFPARPTTRVFGDEGLRPEQVLWIIQRTRAGGEVYIVGKVDNEIFCLHGREAENFNRYTRSELEARNLDYKVVLGVVSKPK